jgi:hypothetical protein
MFGWDQWQRLSSMPRHEPCCFGCSSLCGSTTRGAVSRDRPSKQASSPSSEPKLPCPCQGSVRGTSPLRSCRYLRPISPGAFRSRALARTPSLVTAPPLPAALVGRGYRAVLHRPRPQRAVAPLHLFRGRSWAGRSAAHLKRRVQTRHRQDRLAARRCGAARWAPVLHCGELLLQLFVSVQPM